jgi:lipid-binding SYLF domain-containing protein
MFERNLPKVYAVQEERARRAAEVLDQFARDHQGLANSARAIAVFPNVTKAAFVLGYRWGKGLLSMPDGQCGWIPPSYINFNGGSFGPQWGIQGTDLVLVFFSEDAVRSLLNGKLTLNGTASAAAGPWGRDANAGVTITMASGILAFSRAKGVFLGASVDGSAVTIDDTSNQNVYGEFVRGQDILTLHRVAPNEAVAPFMNALNQNLQVPAQRAAERQRASTATAATN